MRSYHHRNIVVVFITVLLVLPYAMKGQNIPTRTPVTTPTGTPTPVTTQASSESQGVTQKDSLIIEELRNTPLHWSFGGSFTYSAPQGEFKTLLDSLDKSYGLGFSLQTAYSFAPVPFSLGVHASFLFYGGSTESYYNGNTVLGVKLYDTVTTSNTIVPLSIRAKIEPDLGYVKPYLDFSVGFSIISASRTVQIRRPNQQSETKESSSSAPFHYGLGGGIAVKFADVFNIPDSRQAWYAYGGIHYLKGDYTDYKFWDTQSNSFRGANSRTDILLVNVGVVCEF